MERIGFGGGCHWCTEAVFSSLRGIGQVEQGFIASTPPHDGLSEAVIVHFDQTIISLDDLISVHLDTHASTSNHKMRGKYRSAIYVFDDPQRSLVKMALEMKCVRADTAFVTQILQFVLFKPSLPQFQNYYRTDPERPFCKTFIDPKLNFLRKQYSDVLVAELK